MRCWDREHGRAWNADGCKYKEKEASSVQDKDTERGQSSAEALSTSVRLGGIFSSLSCWPMSELVQYLHSTNAYIHLLKFLCGPTSQMRSKSSHEFW